jgi:hypothetical protein
MSDSRDAWKAKQEEEREEEEEDVDDNVWPFRATSKPHIDT